MTTRPARSIAPVRDHDLGETVLERPRLLELRRDHLIAGWIDIAPAPLDPHRRKTLVERLRDLETRRDDLGPRGGIDKAAEIEHTAAFGFQLGAGGLS